MAACTPTLKTDVREVEPVNGWRAFEATGTATLDCPCGVHERGQRDGMIALLQEHGLS